jgi:hypothetical protein
MRRATTNLIRPRARRVSDRLVRSRTRARGPGLRARHRTRPTPSREPRPARCDSDVVRRVALAFSVIAATALVATAVGTSASPSKKRSGIHGRVTSAPTCPLTRTPPESGCDPRGFTANVRVDRLSDRQTVRQLTTASDGRFTVRLAPGRYEVAAEPASGGLHPACGSAKRTVVRAHKYTRLTIECDGGIR